MQAITIIQWTTLSLAGAAVLLAAMVLWLDARTNKRIDQLPKPAWMGQWPSAPGSILSSAYDYSHLSFDWLRQGERLACAGAASTLSANKAGQSIGEGARQDQQHLHEGAFHPAAPAPLVQVVLPIDEGYSTLRSQANAISEHAKAATNSHASIGKEAGLEQLGASPALGTPCFQVLKLRQAMALSHLQNADVQRQIDRLVATDFHGDCPVCGDEQSGGRSNNSTRPGTSLPVLDGATADANEVAGSGTASTTSINSSAP